MRGSVAKILRRVALDGERLARPAGYALDKHEGASGPFIVRADGYREYRALKRHWRAG